jgi:hypothetical protein
MANPEPTVPLIVYLHADRLIPKRPHLGNGTHIPCSDHVVETQALATLLFASAFWSLRQAGLLAIEIVDDANGRSPHTEVMLTSVGRYERPGLEGAVMADLEGPETLSEVVFRWSAQHSTDPWHDGVAEVVAEATAAGYLREVPSGGGLLARWLPGRSSLEPDCERIRDLGGRYESFAREWGGFEVEESALHGALVEQCRKALIASSERWYP